MEKKSAVAAILVFFAFLSSPAGAAPLIIGNGTAPDAYVWDTLADNSTNYGLLDHLQVMDRRLLANPTGDKHFLMRYDLSGWTNISAIHNATLYLYYYDWTCLGVYDCPTELSVEAWNTTDELGWSESNLTWITAPSHGMPQDPVLLTEAGEESWRTWNVTDAFQYELASGNNLTSLRLNASVGSVGDESLYIVTSFYSRQVGGYEAGLKPYVELNVSWTVASGGPTVSTDKGNYSQCGKVFYKLWTYSANETLYTPATTVLVNFSNPSGLDSSFGVTTTNGVYEGSYLLKEGASNGKWLISALSGAVAKHGFFVGSGNRELWKLDLYSNNTKGVYNNSGSADTDYVNFSFLVLNLEGEGVPGLASSDNMSLIRYGASKVDLGTGSVVDQGNGYYYYLMDFDSGGAFPAGTEEYVFEVSASADGGIWVSNSTGFNTTG